MNLAFKIANVKISHKLGVHFGVSWMTADWYFYLLCIHVKEPTKYPKSTDQISGGIGVGK